MKCIPEDFSHSSMAHKRTSRYNHLLKLDANISRSAISDKSKMTAIIGCNRSPWSGNLDYNISDGHLKQSTPCSATCISSVYCHFLSLSPLAFHPPARFTRAALLGTCPTRPLGCDGATACHRALSRVTCAGKQARLRQRRVVIISGAHAS